ncbi:PhoP/PhoQ regulator MgrB [Chimaeribacter californicus]|nr:PhoP/PhoQ regulator MgrB [Chimaeribacter californicus]
MNLKFKMLATVVVIGAACIALYLLALNSYCDQGGNFTLGMCSVTSFIPW